MKTKDFTQCALVAAFISVCAMITIPLPFTAVPITLQVMAILIAGCVLGLKKGTMSVVIYLLLGCFGMPVFSGMKGGVGVLFGPTGGFLIGFIPAVALIGYLTEKTIQPENSKRTKYYKLAFNMVMGMLVLYVFGTIQLMLLAKLSLKTALMTAVIPFVFIDLCKMALAVSVSIYLRSHFGNLFFIESSIHSNDMEN